MELCFLLFVKAKIIVADFFHKHIIATERASQLTACYDVCCAQQW